MAIKEIKPYTKRADEAEDVEAEIVEEETSSGDDFGGVKQGMGTLSRFKITLAVLIFFLGLLILMPGFLLTSTIIGAIIGIPLMILGFSLIWAALKIAFSKSENIIFKTFKF